MENYNEFEQEPTLQERYDEAAKRLIEIYGKCIEDGRYDMAFNRLSKYLYHLRSLQFEIEQDRQLVDMEPDN